MPDEELFATDGTMLAPAKLNVEAASVFTAGVIESDGRLRTIPIRAVSDSEYSVESTSFNNPVENKADSVALGTLSFAVDSLLLLAVASVRGDFGKRISCGFAADVPNVMDDGKLTFSSCFGFD